MHDQSQYVYENKENGWQNVAFICTFFRQVAGYSHYLGETEANTRAFWS